MLIYPSLIDKSILSGCTHNEERKAVEEDEAGVDEEEAPLGVLAEPLDGEVEEPEQPDGREGGGVAEYVVWVGADVDRFEPCHIASSRTSAREGGQDGSDWCIFCFTFYFIKQDNLFYKTLFFFLNRFSPSLKMIIRMN